MLIRVVLGWVDLAGLVDSAETQVAETAKIPLAFRVGLYRPQSSAAEIGPTQEGTSEISLVHLGVIEPCPTEVSLAQGGIVNVSFSEIDPAEDCTA